jgi:hypothetical protein
MDAAFWASLRREEGYMPRMSLAFVAPEKVKWPLMFERRLPLAAQPLTRLARSSVQAFTPFANRVSSYGIPFSFSASSNRTTSAGLSSIITICAGFMPYRPCPEA